LGWEFEVEDENQVKGEFRVSRDALHPSATRKDYGGNEVKGSYQ
jgi:hypothetical protein